MGGILTPLIPGPHLARFWPERGCAPTAGDTLGPVTSPVSPKGCRTGQGSPANAQANGHPATTLARNLARPWPAG